MLERIIEPERNTAVKVLGLDRNADILRKRNLLSRLKLGLFEVSLVILFRRLSRFRS